MVTNFAHMKEWNVMYQKLLFLEDLILDVKNKESCIQIISTGRAVIDVLLKELVKVAGITDEQILRMKKDTFHNSKEGDKISLFDRIIALEAMGYISAKSAENLHTIRKYGNPAIHGEETFVNKPLNELKSIAEKVYELLYKETYLFANQYAQEAKSRRGEKNSTNSTTNQSGVVLGVMAIVVVFILMLMFINF